MFHEYHQTPSVSQGRNILFIAFMKEVKRNALSVVTEDDLQSGKQLVSTFCRQAYLGPSCSKRLSVEKRQRINVSMDVLLLVLLSSAKFAICMVAPAKLCSMR